MMSRVDEAGSEGATAIIMSRMLFVPKVVFTYPRFTELNHQPIFNKNSNHDVEDAFRPKGRPLSSSSLIKKNISDPRFTELNH